MKIQSIGGHDYKLPDVQSTFEREMYVHLIQWKWVHVSKDAGHNKHKGRMIPYDAILPDDCKREEKIPHLHPSVWGHLVAHRSRNPFRIHPHFYHMASSQAANINLFLPILHSSAASTILCAIKNDFKELATDQLDHGYCLEYWGRNFEKVPSGKGLLGDKSARAGTDADIAIAYRNHQDELCLWLIEHKLVEQEFTACGGFKSKGRTNSHNCTRSFSQMLTDPSACYYHDKCQYRYWNITKANEAFFVNHAKHPQCPFQGGMNQLWRNQLLALATEQQGNFYKHAHFSVVRHPENKALETSLVAYQDLIANNSKFSTFTSAAVIQASEQHADSGLREWISWYKELYYL
ncbi:MAG: hypothetical protein RBR35_20260 [Salinivirgaceae bacterium]|jgi:hypothetical protein|nr:hypothetical protein [Salinivirgaceae bacterium]